MSAHPVFRKKGPGAYGAPGLPAEGIPAGLQYIGIPPVTGITAPEM